MPAKRKSAKPKPASKRPAPKRSSPAPVKAKKPTAKKPTGRKPAGRAGQDMTSKDVRRVGKAVMTAVDVMVDVGKHIDKKLVQPLINSASGYLRAAKQAGAAELEARIMQRALQIKKANMKSPGPEAIKRARRELTGAG